jgi:hypothetical protein
MNPALEHGIPITSPSYFAACTELALGEVFAPSSDSRESMALLPERLAIMHEVGAILLKDYGGSYYGLLERWQSRYGNQGTALQLVQMIVEAFPSFRDQASYMGRTGQNLAPRSHIIF